MDLEQDLVNQIVDLLNSADKDNHTLVAAVLEINPLDYSDASVSANIDKITRLAEYVCKDVNLTKRFPIEGYSFNIYAVATRVYELLLSGEIRKNTNPKEIFSFFAERLYKRKILVTLNKKGL